MVKIFFIALHTLREEFRRKTQVILFLFPPICIYISTIFVSFTPGYEKAFIVDISLSVMSFFSMLVSAFLTSDLFAKEEQQGTIYFYLSNPVKLWELIGGKFIGGMILIFFMIISMGMLAKILILIKFHQWDMNFLKAVFLLPGQFMILISCGIFGAILLSKYTNFIVIALVYVLGHLSSYMGYIQEHLQAENSFFILKWLLKIIPNLKRFEARDYVVVGMKIEWTTILNSYGYAIIITVLILILSNLLLNNRVRQ